MTKREEVFNMLVDILQLDKNVVKEDSKYYEDLEIEDSFLFFQLHAILEDRYNTTFDIYCLKAETVGLTLDYIISIIGE